MWVSRSGWDGMTRCECGLRAHEEPRRWLVRTAQTGEESDRRSCRLREVEMGRALGDPQGLRVTSGARRCVTLLDHACRFSRVRRWASAASDPIISHSLQTSQNLGQSLLCSPDRAMHQARACWVGGSGEPPQPLWSSSRSATRIVSCDAEV